MYLPVADQQLCEKIDVYPVANASDDVMDDIGPLTNTKNRLKKRTLIDLMAKAESFSFFPPLEDQQNKFGKSNKDKA